jgi:4a-hydroxytetrahydrobiopterin dehydratase
MTPPEQTTSDDLEFPTGWRKEADGKRIFKQIKTKDFMAAVALIEEIARIAEDENHHPDLHLTGYKNLKIVSWSHDKGRLTDRDARLAERIEDLLLEKDLRGE